MISKAHKDKLEKLWTKGLEDRDRGAMIQVWMLYQSLSSGNQKDIGFGNHLLSLRDELYRKETYIVVERLLDYQDFGYDIDYYIDQARESKTPFKSFKKAVLPFLDKWLNTEEKAINSLAYDFAFDKIPDAVI